MTSTAQDSTTPPVPAPSDSDRDQDATDHRYVVVVAALMALLLIGGPLALWWMTARSSASFSDTEIFDENKLGAATLDIEIGPEATEFNALNLAPGDIVSGQLALKNAGSLPLEFSVTARASQGVLRDWLVLSMWRSTSSCRADDVSSGNAATVLSTAVALTDGRARLADASIDETPALRLGVGAETVMCLGAQLSLDAPNEVQGRQLVIDVTVDAVHDLDGES